MHERWGLSPQELMAHVGSLRQLGGIRPVILGEGLEEGVRCLEVETGGGLCFDVLPSRGLDISRLRYKGDSMVWQSPNGDIHPAYIEPGSSGWLRGFAGGLLTTCGLDTFGAPSQDGQELFDLHGRVSRIPAFEVRHGGAWADGDCTLVIEGKVRQARVFGENLLLERRITTRLGSSRIALEDAVTNQGFEPQPHMMLYHCNFGFPLLDPEAWLEFTPLQTLPRDEAARAGLGRWSRFESPTPAYAEQVFRHRPSFDGGNARLALRNPALGVTLHLGFSQTLPYLFEWKMMSQGLYVLGLEPANCGAIEGRASARERNELPLLEPGEQRQYSLTFEFESTGRG